MCRYARSREYDRHFACFACRRMFRRPPGIVADVPSPVCPRCRGAAHDLGLDFEPPPASDVRAWRAAELLHAGGVTFHSCGCGGPGHRPRDPRRVPDFLREVRAAHRSAGQLLAERFAARRPHH